MRFQVYQTQGFEEPWWFNEDWHEDVVSVETSESLEDAASIYLNKINKLQATFPKYRSRIVGMAAFWQPGELSWCEPCANDEQVYHSLVLYENHKPLNDQLVNELIEVLEIQKEK